MQFPAFSGRTSRARILVILFGLLAVTPAFGQFRVVQWNVAKLVGDTTAMRDVFEALESDNVPGYATAPHVYVMQEVRSNNVSTILSLLNQAHPSHTYATATFTSSGSEDGSGGAQALFYRTDLVSEYTPAHKDIYTGAGRDTDRWLLRLTGYSLDLYVYSCHLKAGSGDANQRETGALAIRADANALPASAHVIYIGDFNFYSNSEDGYQVMVSAGAKQGVDPLGTANWTGSSNAWKHTQSPRTITDVLIGGGMDDRFDQHLTSSGLQDGVGLAIDNYRPLGNDGDHYNTAINLGNNFYFPGELSRSNALADALHDASDHIPVVVDYQLPGLISAFVQDEQGTVILGATVNVDVLATNLAQGEIVDSCPAIIEGSSGIYGDDTIFDLARYPDFDTVTLLLDTTSVGDITGIVSVRGLAEDQGGADLSLETHAVVIAHAQPSLSAASLVQSIELDVKVEPRDDPLSIEIPIHNWDYSQNQARFSVTGVNGTSSPLTVTSVPGGLIGSSSDSVVLAFDPAGQDKAALEYTLEIMTQEESLPGSTSNQLDVILTISVGGGANPMDLNGDGRVDGADLAMLLGSWGQSTYDLNGDGIVDGADLAMLLGAWG